MSIVPMGHLLNNMTANRNQMPQHIKLSKLKGGQWKTFEDRIPSGSLIVKKSSRDFAKSDENWRIQRLNSSESAIVRLDNRDRDVYGTCPERDTFVCVVCKDCSDILKPSALSKHIRDRHGQHSSTTSRSQFIDTCPVSTFNTQDFRDDAGDRFLSTYYASTSSGSHYTSTFTNSNSKLKISMAPQITVKNVNPSPPKPKNRSLVYTKPKPKNGGKRGPTLSVLISTQPELSSKSLESTLQKVSLDHLDMNAKSLQSVSDPLCPSKGVKTVSSMLSKEKTYNSIERKPLLNPQRSNSRTKYLSALKGLQWSRFADTSDSWKKTSTDSIDAKYSNIDNAAKLSHKLDIMRLDYEDRGVFGMSPETEELCAVICKGCSTVLKPQGLLIHQENRGCLHNSTSHSGSSNSSWPTNNSYLDTNRVLTKFNSSTHSKAQRMSTATNSTVTISMAPPTSCTVSAQTHLKSKSRSGNHSKIKSKHSKKGGSLPSSPSTNTSDTMFNIGSTWSPSSSSELTAQKANFSSNDYMKSLNDSGIATSIETASSIALTSSSSSSNSSSSSSSSSSSTSSQGNRNSTSQRCLPIKDREYDSDVHCGVLSADTNKPCTRSLTCRSHMISLRRAVPGRSKSFDKLLTDHKNAKENLVITSSKSNPLPAKGIRVKSFADLESNSNSSSSFDMERRSIQTTILNSNSNSCSSLHLQASDAPSTISASLLMSPILTNVIASSTTNSRRTNSSPITNREGYIQNESSNISSKSILKSMDSTWSEDSVPAHMEYLEYDEDDNRQRFGSGKRPPPSDLFSNQSENAKRIRLTNSTDLPRINESNSRLGMPTDNTIKNSVTDDIIESQYIVDDGDQVVYVNEGQISRSSDMTGIENETVEALMQSLSPYEFSFNEMGQLMITEPIFENEDTSNNATAGNQVTNAIITDVVADQQLTECNITPDDLDDIDQLVAPILETSESEGFDLVAYTMKKSSDSISDTSSSVKETQPSTYSLLLNNKPRKVIDHNYNISSGISVCRLAEIDQLICNGEPIELANDLSSENSFMDYQNLFSESDGSDEETSEDVFGLTNDEQSLFFGSHKYSTTDVIDQNGVVPSDNTNGYGEKENNDDVDDFRGVRNWYGSVPKPLNINRFGMGKTKGGSALRRNILTARKSNPTHQAYNYAINNHSIKFNSSNHDTTIRLDQNGSTTNTFQLLRTNGSVIRASQKITSNSASGNGVGVLNRACGRRIGQIVQTQKLNRRLMTLGTAFDNVVANVAAGSQFLRPLNPKTNQLDDKLKMIKRGMHKINQITTGGIRRTLSNVLPSGSTLNGFSLDDIIGARPRSERNNFNHSGSHASNHDASMNGTTKKAKSYSFNKDTNHPGNNLKTNHTSSVSSSSNSGQSILKNSVYMSSLNAKHSSNRSNHRHTSSATNMTTSLTIATTTSTSISNGSLNTAATTVHHGNVIMLTSMSSNTNRGRSLIKPSLYSRSVSGSSGNGSSGSGNNSANPRK